MEWQEIPWYEWIYKISEFWDLISLWNDKYRKQKIKKSFVIWKYLTSVLVKDWKRRTCRINRLVALAFIPNPENYPICLHLDNDTLNNHKSNLKWWTQSENTQQAYDQWRKFWPLIWRKWSDNHLSKWIVQFSLSGEFIKEWWSIMDIQRELWIHHSSISKCCIGKLKTSWKFIWKYSNLCQKLEQ